jgi:hypothetical protein
LETPLDSPSRQKDNQNRNLPHRVVKRCSFRRDRKVRSAATPAAPPRCTQCATDESSMEGAAPAGAVGSEFCVRVGWRGEVAGAPSRICMRWWFACFVVPARDRRAFTPLRPADGLRIRNVMPLALHLCAGPEVLRKREMGRQWQPAWSRRDGPARSRHLRHGCADRTTHAARGSSTLGGHQPAAECDAGWNCAHAEDNVVCNSAAAAAAMVHCSSYSRRRCQTCRERRTCSFSSRRHKFSKVLYIVKFI